VDRTYLILLPDISSDTGHIWFKAGLIRRAFSAATFDDCFEGNFLTVSPIDPILLLLAS
jgi:hypothetical protein